MENIIEKSCRLCLEPGADFMMLTDTKDPAVDDLLIIIQRLYGIENINKNNVLPKRICHECKRKTCDFYCYSLQVKENQKTLEALKDEFEDEVNQETWSEQDETVFYNKEIEKNKEDAYEPDTNIPNEFKTPLVDEETSMLFECEHCEKSFRNKKAIANHMNLHKSTHSQLTKTTTLRNNGNKQTKTKENKEAEDKAIISFFDLQCTLCLKSQNFKSWIDYRNHMILKHNDPYPFLVCCNKKLRNKRDIYGHAIYHTDPNQLKCKECGKQNLSFHRLNEHIYSYHNPNGYKYKCHQCPRSYATSAGLKHHSSIHWTEEERAKEKLKNVCPDCGMCYLTRPVLIQHIRSTHMKVYTSVCEFCAKSFKSKQALKIHYELKHSTIPPEKKQCPECFKWVIAKFLRKHMNSMHYKRKTFTCKMCNKQVRSENALKLHIEHIHTIIPKYPCKFCDKAFRWPTGLKEHQVVHFGGAPLYQCSFCDKTFNSGANMIKHKKKMHSNERI